MIDLEKDGLRKVLKKLENTDIPIIKVIRAAETSLLLTIPANHKVAFDTKLVFVKKKERKKVKKLHIVLKDIEGESLLEKIVEESNLLKF